LISFKGFTKIYKELVLGVFSFKDILRLEPTTDYDSQIENRLIERLKSHHSFNSKILWEKKDKSCLETEAYIFGEKVLITAVWGKIHIERETKIKNWFPNLLLLSSIYWVGYLSSETSIFQTIFLIIIYFVIYFYLYFANKVDLKLKWERTKGYLEGILGDDLSSQTRSR
jgi:hypothetical protein